MVGSTPCQPGRMLPPAAEASVNRYVALADRLLPRRICGFYVIGSAALGAFRPGRSDIDFVALVDGELSDREMRRVRALHLLTAGRSAARALARGDRSLPGTCNGVFVSADDIGRPVTAIRPLASHTGPLFARGAGFDANPVTWKVFRDSGIAVRGPAPLDLGLDPEPDRLRQWNLDNLNSYWRRWADTTLRGRPPMSRLSPPRWVTAWGVLGAPRLHHTIATGGVVSKEAAGEYALETFDASWHPIIREALAYRRTQPADPAFADPVHRNEQLGAFVAQTIDDANRLPTC